MTVLSVIGTVHSIVFFIIDIVLLNLMIYVTSLFRFIQFELEELDKKLRKISILSSDEINQTTKVEMSAIVQHHDNVLALAKKLKKICSISMLLYYLSFSVLICLLINDFRTVTYF